MNNLENKIAENENKSRQSQIKEEPKDEITILTREGKVFTLKVKKRGEKSIFDEPSYNGL